ncbi:CoA transferase [Pusillimonas sp. MFBS29]|uniref:CaiB/BaiF CoA transferase family protein n=1 Tax=Pusillimonas sp. MFBS29 TaxID=2886690 RepID=UPI001D0F6699|nr:CaiB/BaiF CoA-transferase family protein [Pusillimonas sp. MFBS29]MCC2596985.1 CoA transferase [Pusillimonas sp. MFBS29]
MSATLQGLRIIEMVGLGPAPFAAMMLADHGAEVVRIHPAKRKADFPLLDTRFDVLARGRKSLAVDLRAPAGSELLLELISNADGLIEGFRPGVMERLGLSPEVCLARNPKLVYGRMTGWGQTGPLANQVGHDLNYLGITGALHAIGPADGPPTVPLNYVADFGGGGMLLAFGMVAALLAVRGGGSGQVVDAAMTDGVGLLSSMFWGFRAGGAWPNGRGQNLLDGGAYFYATYACADGRYLAVACVEKRFHDILVERLALEPEEFTHDRQPARWPSLRQKLAELFATKPRDHWVSLFEGTDGCVTPILDWSEAVAHPHATRRNAFVDVEGVIQPAPAPRFSATPAPMPTAAPRAGAHSLETLHAWGVSARRISDALAQGVIVQAESEASHSEA